MKNYFNDIFMKLLMLELNKYNDMSLALASTFDILKKNFKNYFDKETNN